MKLFNNMKLFYNITLIAIGILSSISLFSQTECDLVDEAVNQLLSKVSDDQSVFISDGQVYKAFLNEDQKAEFEVTLFGGSNYRIAGSTGDNDNSFIFEIYDKEQPRNLLFSNTEFNNSAYWDFKIENTIDCYIVTSIDLTKKLSGCAVMMIGFEN